MKFAKYISINYVLIFSFFQLNNIHLSLNRAAFELKHPTIAFQLWDGTLQLQFLINPRFFFVLFNKTVAYMVIVKQFVDIIDSQGEALNGQTIYDE